jgi:hypothetical protein
MRPWLTAAGESARIVAERPDLWLAGALAWVTSVGWIPFVVAVARPPSDAELTFLGARFVTSGAWPMNAVAVGALLVAVVIAAFAVVATANAVLIALLSRRRATVESVRRLFTTALAASVPTAVLLVLLLVVAASIAPGSFNAPDGGGAVPRLLLRLAPILLALGAAIVVGAAFAATAGRGRGLGDGPRALLQLRRAGWTQVVIGTSLGVAFLGLAALLLGVLWAPIRVRLESGRIGIDVALLLVGFVAIWLCLVLAGGALHAWSATTWSRLLATGSRSFDSGRM